MSITSLAAFTPPPSCLATDDIWAFYADPPGRRYFVQGGPTRAECFPSGYVPTTTAFYSPGLCPSGYTAASSDVNTAGSVTETTHFCCPSAIPYHIQTAKDDTALPFLTTLMCESKFTETASFTVTSSRAGDTPTVDFVTVDGIAALNAYGIQVRFQATDFATSTPTSTATSETSTSSTLPASPLPSSSGGLSLGAKVGIGVGVMGAVLLTVLALTIGFVIGKRRKRSLHGNGFGKLIENNGSGVHGVSLYARPKTDESYVPTGGRYELPARQVGMYELPAR
ncbi:hypothetical protein BU26DRAFT_521179 [Trematosphaeria pertusa]|uniref:Mid2 domain-containing protein n=1 Tax=Trematosphaeria pertusa TaxID=390896 RepID=A0A6A6I8Q6_9PLEO|nr:uncharacterized protein BU26DRAFT_521179 [Trematosphaeria pertusa]KAF2246746.1 hypothetical protein BU26DRAFT_521179 [Trematosphaeria pertusa]